MTPLTVNPNVLVLVNPEGKIEAVATNVAPDLAVTVITDPSDWRKTAANLPFRTDTGTLILGAN